MTVQIKKWFYDLNFYNNLSGKTAKRKQSKPDQKATKTKQKTAAIRKTTTDKPVKKARVIRKRIAKNQPVVEFAEYVGTLSEIVESKDIRKDPYFFGTVYKKDFFRYF